MYKLILLTFLTGCGTINTYKNVENSDFMYPVKRFERYYGKKVDDIDIKFDNLGAYRSWNTMGVCSFKTSKIKVDMYWWRHIEYLKYKKEALILHEIGHCILFRDHVEGVFEDGCPISLMNKNIVSNKCAKKYRDYYIKELVEG